MWSSLVIGFDFFIVAIPLHVLFCRLTSSYKFMSKSVLVGLSVLLFLCGYQHQSSSVDFVSVYVFATLWFAYLSFILALVKSTTLKMLDALAKDVNGELHLNEFTRFFHQDEGLKNRLVTMKMNGFISIQHEKLCLTQRAQKTLSFVDFIRRLFALVEKQT